MNNFCIAPFVHMYVHSNEGSRVCCMTTESSELTSDVELNLEERWQGKYLQNIREDFLNNKRPDICSKCFTLEDSGGVSDRNRFNEQYEYLDIDLDTVHGNQFKSPIDLDIRPGNLCNLKCRMCGPISSSQIQKEVQKNNKELNVIYGEGVFDTTTVLQDEKNIEFLLRNADKGRRIKFLGGEPTIMPEVDKFLDILLDSGMTDVPLHFTTNCTNSKKSFIDKISNFTAISFNYSIDGIGKTVEYIRDPVSFEAINENIRIYHEIASHGQITYTYQAYNFFNLWETVKWSNDLGITLRPEVLLKPDWCNIRVLPVRFRHKYVSMLKRKPEIQNSISALTILPVLNQLLSDDVQYDDTQFVNYTKRLDTVRNKHIRDYIPEVWNMISEQYDA